VKQPAGIGIDNGAASSTAYRLAQWRLIALKASFRFT